MREVAFDAARHLGCAAVEKRLTLAELYAAEQVWMCNSLFGLVPVRRLAQHSWHVAPDSALAGQGATDGAGGSPMRWLIGVLLALCAAGAGHKCNTTRPIPPDWRSLRRNAASGCTRSALIHQRLTRPVARQGDVTKMKSRLQDLAASAVKYCPADNVSGLPAVTRR